MRLRNELAINEMTRARSEELNHAKLQFFTNITHELLTPLTIISAVVDELKQAAPQYDGQYRVMRDNANRLIRLLQQILEFRKSETGNLKLKVSQGDLSQFVRHCVESFLPLQKKKRMDFSLDCPPEPFYAYFDTDKVDKILYNLLSNAFKYTEEGGSVRVELGRDDTSGRAVIRVRDNGSGISPEAQKTLFKRFYEGEYRRHKTIGTGIGLSLTKDLVELHGGTIAVESGPGRGTCFTVTLPVGRADYPADAVDDALPAPVPVPADSGSREADTAPADPGAKSGTLLLIEDNEELLELMSRLLEREYNVFTAAEGREGLDVLRREEIDLVVSDVMMEGMDGIAFCKAMKGDLESSHIPVILLTARTDEGARVEAYESGADGFISKPFNLSVLQAKIGSLLKARERTNRDFKRQLVFDARQLDYTSIDEEFLQRAIDCVYRHLDDSGFEQTQLIGELGTSRSTLFRKLKSLTGLNCSSFIRNIRLKAACQILEEKPGIRISELAYAVGFGDPKYFSACFKKEFGVQPSEWKPSGRGEPGKHPA